MRHRPDGEWRGQKGALWGGGHCEPFIARGPGHLPAGSVLFASGSVKAHANPVWDKENPRRQLYEVESDPYEKHDLWDADPAVVRELYLRLQEMCADESSGLPFGVPL